MTDVFVHYWQPGKTDPTNEEMLFSRLPVPGESVYIGEARYEVFRVDHRPEKATKGRKSDQRVQGYPNDADIWLRPTAADVNPLGIENPLADNVEQKRDLVSVFEIMEEVLRLWHNNSPETLTRLEQLKSQMAEISNKHTI